MLLLNHLRQLRGRGSLAQSGLRLFFFTVSMKLMVRSGTKSVSPAFKEGKLIYSGFGRSRKSCWEQKDVSDWWIKALLRTNVDRRTS